VVSAKLHAPAPRNYGRRTAELLVDLARHGVEQDLRAARSSTLQIACDQLEHTQANVIQLESEIDTLLETDTGAKWLKSVPEFGRKTVVVLRAE
jgi:transposase